MAWFRFLAGFMVLGLWLAPTSGIARRLGERLFARLSFTPYLAGRTPAAIRGFVERLLGELARKQRRREVSFQYLVGWVSALLAQAFWGPRRRARARESSGVEPSAFVILSPSAACNLRCTHCYAASERVDASTLSFPEVDALVQGFERQGTNLIIVSGGEPLLWRNGEDDLFTLASRHASMLFVVYTNGTRIDAALAQRFRRAGNVLPLVSLEGFQKDTDSIRGAGTFAKVELAMAELRRAGVLFGLSVTASLQNAHSLTSPAFEWHFVDHAGASFLWVLELSELGPAEEQWLLDDKKREELQRVLDQEAETGRLVVSFLHTASSHTGCFGAHRFDGFVYVDWHGVVHRCVYQPEPLLRLRRSAESGIDVASVLAGAGHLPACAFGNSETRSAS